MNKYKVGDILLCKKFNYMPHTGEEPAVTIGKEYKVVDFATDSGGDERHALIRGSDKSLYSTWWGDFEISCKEWD